MNEKIKQHTKQSEFHSRADEILRRITLNKSDIYDLIQECYNEEMRLQIQGQQQHNKRTTNKEYNQLNQEDKERTKAIYLG